MQKLNKLLFVIPFLLLLVNKGTGQQLPLLSQYMMDLYQINPAFAGHDGYTTINLTAHEQWIGMPNTPKTHTLSLHSRLYEQSYIRKENPVKKKWRRPFKGGRVGVGTSLYNDRLGLINRTGLQLTYAYHIPFEVSQLSFGLSATAFQYKVDVGGLELYEKEDPFILNYDGTMFIPDANFGANFSTRNTNVGFSINQLFQSSLKLGNQGESKYQILRHYYFVVNHTFQVGSNVKIRPYLLAKTSNNFVNIQADLNVTVYYNEDYWGGLSYRTNDAMVIMGGLRYNQFYLGYAFDYSFNRIKRYNYGSHEIIVGLRIGDTARRYRWLTEM